MERIQARWFTDTGKAGRTIRLLVVHDMEAPEATTTAEAVARYFAQLPSSNKASAHYCHDSDSDVQCVDDMDVAYAAPGANHDGLHFELAGYARQTAAEWADPYSAATIARCAVLLAAKATQYGLPVEYLDVAAVKAGRKGITTHRVISEAYKQSTHTDPGPNFPMARLIELVKYHQAPPPPPAPAQLEVTGVRFSFHNTGQFRCDDKGRGWQPIPCPISKLGFLACQGSAPARDGYWPPMGWNVNDSGDTTIVTVDGQPGQAGIIYWSQLEAD